LFIRNRNDIGVPIGELVEESKRLGSHPNAAYRFIDRSTRANPQELEKRVDRIFPTKHMKGD